MTAGETGVAPRMLTEEQLQQGFRIGDWEVYPARAQFRCGDTVEKPEPMHMLALLALAKRDGDVVSKDELVNEVWGGRFVADDAIAQCISRLRGKLGDTQKPFRYIEAVVKVGYRLLQPVILMEPPVLNVTPADVPDTSPPGPPEVRTWLPWAVAALAAVVVGKIIADAVIEPPLAAPPIGSIAVLPCENLSGNADDQYIVDGFKDALVETLHNIPDFTVKHGRVRYADLEVDEIAEKLGVESVLFCSLQRQDDTIKVNFHVARGSDGTNMSSGSITDRANAIFRMHEDLATKLRDDLLGTADRGLLATSRPANDEAFDRYMLAQYAFSHRGEPGNLENAIRLFGEAIELDPNFGPAYMSLAMAYALLPDLRNAALGEAHAQANEIFKKGVEADPGIAEAAQAIQGYIYHKQKAWLLAEQAYQRAINAVDPDVNAFNWYSLMLAGVGRLDDARDMAMQALQHDPSNGVIESRVAIAYTWLGDNDTALRYFERAKLLGGTSSTHYLAYSLVLQRVGRLEEARESLEAGVTMAGGGSEWIDSLFAAFENADYRAEALAALDTAAAARTISPQLEVTLRAMLADVDGAVAAASRIARKGVPYEMDLLFLPELAELRQRPEFMNFMAELGITEYWSAVGCVWQGTAVQCPERI